MSKILDNSEELIKKYSNVLELYDGKKYDHTFLSQILEHSVEHIKDIHPQMELQHKIAAVYIVIRIFKSSPNKFNFNKITLYINQFFDYVNKEYKKYIESLVLISDGFDADMTFYMSFK